MLRNAPKKSARACAEKREKRGPAHLHRALARLDPESAARISAADTQKIIRAIELRLLTGKPVGEIHRSGRHAPARLRNHQARPAAATRRALRAHSTPARNRCSKPDGSKKSAPSSPAAFRADAKPFQFIGYSQLREHLAGRLSEKDAVQQIQQATRHFAKRQLTWFRKESGVHWLPGFGDAPEITAAALAIVKS